MNMSKERHTLKNVFNRPTTDEKSLKK